MAVSTTDTEERSSNTDKYPVLFLPHFGEVIGYNKDPHVEYGFKKSILTLTTQKL